MPVPATPTFPAMPERTLANIVASLEALARRLDEHNPDARYVPLGTAIQAAREAYGLAAAGDIQSFAAYRDYRDVIASPSVPPEQRAWLLARTATRVELARRVIALAEEIEHLHERLRGTP